MLKLHLLKLLAFLSLPAVRISPHLAWFQDSGLVRWGRGLLRTLGKGLLVLLLFLVYLFMVGGTEFLLALARG